MVFNIYFRATADAAQIPVKAHEGDAGWDLFTSKDSLIPEMGWVDVNTHIEMALPLELWARITARSSTWRAWHLMVMEGIIDSGYRGELFIGVYNPSKLPVEVPCGTRLAQLILHQHTGPVTWTPCKELAESTRGTKGFGSSGK